MNQGFKTYFGEGFKASMRTMYQNKNILLVWLYTVLATVGHLTVIFAPIFYLADIRHAKYVHADNRVHVVENFRVACKGKALGAYYGAIFLEVMITIAALVLIGIGTGFLAVIGLLVSYAAPDFPLEYMLIIFSAPGGLVALAFLVMVPVFFAPTAYIIESNPGISAAATVSTCIKTMRRGGKWTCFLNTFLPVLIAGAIAGVGFGAIQLCNALLDGYTDRAIAQGVLLMFTTALILFTYPIFNMTRQVAQKSLFDDICLDPVNANKHTPGVNIQKCQGVLFEPETIEENLSILFDETQEEEVPLPSSAARSKRNESARMGESKVDLSDGDEVYYENDNSDRQEQS